MAATFSNGLLLLSLCLLAELAFLPVTESCTCLESHIQQQFCTADFVIRARVKAEPVVIYEEGEKYQYPVSQKYEIDVKDIYKGDEFFNLVTQYEESISSEEISMESLSNEAERRFRRDLEEFSDTLSNARTEVNMTNAAVTTQTVTNETTEELETVPPIEFTTVRPEANVTLPPTEIPIVPSKTWLYTSYHSSLCGIRLRPRTSYLLTGFLWQGRMWTTVCKHNVPWPRVSSRQRRALSMNLYGKNCACEVGSCIEGCEQTSCNLPHGYHIRKCYQENAHCESKEGQCGWKENRFLQNCLRREV